MKLDKLPKTTVKGKKRVGRGYGSGKGGHTSGRGQKGQKSRSKIGLLFEGTKMRKSLIRRLPMRRGKNKFKSLKPKPIILNVKYLNLLKEGTKVSIEVLIKNNLVDKEAKKIGVKILGDGDLKKKLFIMLPASKSAQKKIEKAGGKVVNIEKEKKPAVKKPKKTSDKAKPVVLKAKKALKIKGKGQKKQKK